MYIFVLVIQLPFLTWGLSRCSKSDRGGDRKVALCLTARNYTVRISLTTGDFHTIFFSPFPYACIEHSRMTEENQYRILYWNCAWLFAVKNRTRLNIRTYWIRNIWKIFHVSISFFIYHYSYEIIRWILFNKFKCNIKAKSHWYAKGMVIFFFGKFQ